jgi:hypothetical protein
MATITNDNQGPFYVGQSLQIDFETNIDLTGAKIKVRHVPPGKTRLDYATGRISKNKVEFDFVPSDKGNHRFWLYGLDKNNKVIISSPVDVFVREEGT